MPEPAKLIRFWFPVILYSGIIFYASSRPNLTTPLPEIFSDKVLHFLEFTPFGLLTARALKKSKPEWSGSRICLGVLIISLFYALLDEYHQTFVIGRSAALGDVLADTLGGGAGYMLFAKYNWKVEKKSNHHGANKTI